MDKNRYIPMNKCNDGHLYIIKARNADLGVYIEKEKGFRLSRFKFQLNFIDIEYHWDTGEPHGTVKPLKKLNFLGNMPDGKLLVRLNDYMKSMLYDIKSLKKSLTSSIVLIDPERMRQLRKLNGGD